MNNWKKIRKQNLGQIPVEASANLQAPETAPSRKVNKENFRIKSLNFKVSQSFYQQLRELAVKEGCFMVEILEKALKAYEQQSKNRTTKET